MGVFTQSYTYRDAKGRTARMKIYINAADIGAANTAGHTISDDIVALTNAAFQSAIGPFSSSPIGPVYGAPNQFESVEDKAMFVFVTAAGSVHRYQVPAPKVSIFLADQETVDPANADVAAFAAAMVANVCSRDGSVLTNFSGGIRLRRKLQRRENIYTLTPELTPEEPAE